MRKYAFLFLYEVKNRELESLCLLKYELERRGYSVAIVQVLHHLHRTWLCLPYSATILVTFALYNDDRIRAFSGFCRDFKCIVNLQWEQIYRNRDESDLDTLHHIKGSACNMIHIAWGPFTADKLIDLCGISTSNVVKAGHIAMDFTKPKFHGYYMDREMLLRQYDISADKKILLFISSFSYVDIPKSILESESYQQVGISLMDFSQLSVLSQSTLFQWLRDILPRHPECIFIYRPHPVEIGSAMLAEMEDSLPNFHVIRDFSVKQWISAADKIYTWYSTAAADAYFCGKNFDILRPVPLPYDMELVLYNGCHFITEPQDFDRSIDCPEAGAPIKEETFDRFYGYGKESYTYITISDALEAAFRDPTDRCAQFRKTPKYYTLYRIIRLPLRAGKRWVLDFLGWAYTSGHLKKIHGSLEETVKLHSYIRKSIQNNYVSKREMQMIQNRVKEIIASNTDRDCQQ